MQLEPDAKSWLMEAMQRAPFHEAPVTIDIAIRSRAVSLPHRDPADRFIVATAKVLDLTLVSNDGRLLECKDVKTLVNR